MSVVNKSIFTLFHHVINHHNQIFDFDSDKLYSLSQQKPVNNADRLSDIFLHIVERNIQDYKDSEKSLTLTGGMDSRIILACLLKLGVKPICLTYGNPEAKDIVYARNLAKAFGLQHHNVASVKPDKDWYYKWVVETIKRDNGNSHLHRAHRTAAIAEHVAKYNTKVLFTGHMGGEGLRGLTYNNYFSSKFFEWVNEKKYSIEEAAEKILTDYFVKYDNKELQKTIERVKKLPYMSEDKQKNKLFYLYDLVAKIHHSQDLRIYKSYVPNVVPAFLQNEYLKYIYSSGSSFLSKKKGAWGRLQNPSVYCNVLKDIYPKLLDYPLSNGFKPSEYLRGLWYYVPVKIYRKRKEKKLYPPTFTYGKWYVDFVNEHVRNVSDDIWDIYDKKRYFKALEKNEHEDNEGYWHKFSNPIFFDLVEKYRNGEFT